MIETHRNKKIHKFKVPITDMFKLDLPEDAEILCVQMQFGEPQLWAVVDTSIKQKDCIQWNFYVVGTGNHMPVNAEKYIGTFQIHEGNLVFHLFM